MLLGEDAGVTGDFDGGDGKDGRSGVVAVGVGAVGREAGHHHVRTELADDANDVGEDFVAVPDAEGFFGDFWRSQNRWARVKNCRPSGIKAAGAARSSWVRIQCRSCFAEFTAQKILAAIAARHGEVSHAIAAAARQIGDEGGVFVVRGGRRP